MVETLPAFLDTYSERPVFLLAFPIALGSLEQLFNGTLDITDIASSVKASVPHQFLGLASALTHLHEVCQIAHGSIEPSSVLVYADEGNDELSFKLTGLEMSTDLSAIAAEDALEDGIASTSSYVAADFLKRHASVDVWKLGYVLAELSVFMHRGSHGVLEFRTNLVTEAILDQSEISNGKHINHLMERVKDGFVSPNVFITSQAGGFRNKEFTPLNALLFSLLGHRPVANTARELCEHLMKVSMT